MVDSNLNLKPTQQPSANPAPIMPPTSAPGAQTFAPRQNSTTNSRPMSPLEAALAMRRNAAQNTQNLPLDDPTAPPELPPKLVVPGITKAEPVKTEPKKTEVIDAPAASKPKANPKPRKRRVQNDAVKRPIARKKCFSKDSLKRYAIIGGITLAASIVLAIVISLLTNGPFIAHKSTPYETEAFFVRERQDGGYYALYSREGKKYSDFDIAQPYEFIDGYALVRNTTGKYGIYADNGRMSVKYGTYDKIVSRGPVYVASNNNGNVKIILGNGKVIAKTEYEKSPELIANKNTPFFVYKERDGKYVVYDARGTKLHTISSETQPIIDEASNRDFALITYGDHALILNAHDYSVVSETDFIDGYKVSNYSYDLSLIELRNDEGTAFIASGKFRNDYGDCNTFSFYNDEAISRHYATCNQMDGAHLIGNDGSVSVAPLPSNRINYTPSDFATLESGKISIYKNGEVVKTMSDVTAMYDANGGYYIEHEDPAGGFHGSIFSLSGNQIFTDNAAFGVREIIDDERAVISHGGTYGDYIVMSKRGALSDGYRRIYVASSKLYVAKSGNQYLVLNGAGKQIENRAYSDAEIKEDGSVVAYYDGKIDYYSSDGKIRLVGMNAHNYAYSEGNYIAQRKNEGGYLFYLLDGRQFAEH